MAFGLNFNKGAGMQPTTSQLELVTRQYNSYRNNLLIMVGFTVLNILLLVANADFYMLFSASVPFYSVFLAMFFGDKLPVDYYTDFETGEVYYFNLPGANVFLGIAIAVAVISLAAYLLLWFLSKKSFVPLIIAEVLFVFDTLGLLLVALPFGASSFILDFVFHVAVLAFLGAAIYMGIKKKKLEKQEKDLEGVVFELNETAPEDEKSVLKDCEQPVTAKENAETAPETEEETK
jgi:hypothetical protein